MRHDDWRTLEAERLARLRDRERGDFGQADYSERYGYDPHVRSGYRRADEGDRGHAPGRPAARRDGPSDRVLWAVIMERLDAERRLDLRHVDVAVLDGEVTLNGSVRHKADKRRIEDVADIDGVRNVQNNLRVAESDRRWMFF